MAETREPQYQRAVELRDQGGLATIGVATNQTWRDDPKRLTFMLSRYKFVSKMFSGFPSVLEVGCGDAFGSRIVAQDVTSLTAVDFDPIFIEDANKHMDSKWRFQCRVHDMLAEPISEQFDGAYALDVLEHISMTDESRFLGNIVKSLNPIGSLIIGSPSIYSQAYASASSKRGHINCKDAAGMKASLAPFFHRVFLFSMNDEVVHTGFYPMAHYFLALCCQQR